MFDQLDRIQARYAEGNINGRIVEKGEDILHAQAGKEKEKKRLIDRVMDVKGGNKERQALRVDHACGWDGTH